MTPPLTAAHLETNHTAVGVLRSFRTRTQVGFAPGPRPAAPNGIGHGGGPERRIDDLILRDIPLYVWNFGGYQHGATSLGEQDRHAFGSLTDGVFRMIPFWNPAAPPTGLSW